MAMTIVVGAIAGVSTSAGAAMPSVGPDAHRLVLDPDYAPSFVDSYFGAPAQVYDLARLDNGDIVAAGRFNKVDGLSRSAVVRLLPDGTVDPAFATTGTGFDRPAAESMALQPDGKILLGGSFTSYDGQPVGRIVRLNPDGSLDPSFAAAVSGNTVNALAVQRNGKVLAGVGGGTIVRLTDTGTVDPTFSTTMTPQVGVIDIVPRKNGDIYIAGGWDYLNNVQWRFGLARLNSDGSTDMAFDPRPAVTSGYLMDIEVAPGQVIGGGSFTPAGAAQKSQLRAFDTTGAIAPGIGTVAEPDAPVLSVDRRSNGKVVIGGLFTTVGDQTRHGIAQLKADGSVDKSSMGAGAEDGQVWATLALTHGGIVLGGNFTSVDGSPRLALARFVRAG